PAVSGSGGPGTTAAISREFIANFTLTAGDPTRRETPRRRQLRPSCVRIPGTAPRRWGRAPCGRSVGGPPPTPPGRSSTDGDLAAPDPRRAARTPRAAPSDPPADRDRGPLEAPDAGTRPARWRPTGTARCPRACRSPACRPDAAACT